MKYLLLFNFLSNESLILKKSKGKPISFANSTFQKTLLKGISNIKTENDILTCLNIANIGCYPFNFESALQKKDFYSLYDIPVEDISFLNISYIKHLSQYHNLKNSLKHVFTHQEATTVVCYDLSVIVLKALRRLKQKYPIKIIVIVPDLPNLTGMPETRLYKLYKMLPHSDVFDYLDCIDGYVLLSDSMKIPLKVENKPYTVLEGIYDSSTLPPSAAMDRTNDDTFTILYAGALTKRNGIVNLIDCVLEIRRKKPIKLILCGAGDLTEHIIEISRRTDCIDYRGQLPREEILKMQTVADLLVNPRQPDKEFAQYSFPSKTMEYLASGTPVLMYKLSTLPEEYFPYLFFINPNEKNALKEAVLRIMDIGPNARRSYGLKAQEFILKTKNQDVQAKALFDFISKI